MEPRKTKEATDTLPKVVREEIDEFERQISAYRAGEIDELRFRALRLHLGVYTQRQQGFCMQRVKIPYGALTSRQLRSLAEISDRYSDGAFHVTTRQNAQLYYVGLERVPDLMRELAAAGITTREACGNTVRNIVATPLTGVSLTETFDVAPYAEAFKNFMLRNTICQNIGRKFNVCFESDQDVDNAGIRVCDLGFRARVREGRRGFQVYVGGGLGASPKLGYLWTEFLPVEELLPFAASVIRIFDRYGERKIWMKARMKFLVRKLGFEKFRETVERERACLDVDPSWNDYLAEIGTEHESPPDGEYDFPEAPGWVASDAGFSEWMAENVFPAGAEGYSVANVRVVRGDISSDSARRIADMADAFADGRVRFSNQQNIALRWVPDRALESLYAELRRSGLCAPGAGALEDVTVCAGADACRLGITSAKGLSEKLDEMMANGLGKYRKTLADLRIKISGCPNSCAHHAAASIGFHGASLTRDGRTVPAKMLFVGGGLYGDDTRLGIPVAKIPAKSAPGVVRRLLEVYESEKRDGEHFDLAMRRLGAKRLRDELSEFRRVPSYEENPDFYRDWGHEGEEFSIAEHAALGRGPGSGAEEKIPQFSDAERRFEQARALFHHGDYEACASELYLACSESARVPLHFKFVDPFTPEQAVWEFENVIVRAGEAEEKWLDVSRRLMEYRDGEFSKSRAAEFLDMAEEFHSACRKIDERLPHQMPEVPLREFS